MKAVAKENDNNLENVSQGVYFTLKSRIFWFDKKNSTIFKDVAKFHKALTKKWTLHCIFPYVFGKIHGLLMRKRPCFTVKGLSTLKSLIFWKGKKTLLRYFETSFDVKNSNSICNVTKNSNCKGVALPTKGLIVKLQHK